MLLRLKGFVSAAIVASTLMATSFAHSAIVIKDWEYTPAAVLALSLARSGNVIPEADMGEVIQSLSAKGQVPRRYQAQYERLLHVAQMLLTIKSAKHYFPVGFEFETGHHTIDSIDNFEAGVKAISKSIAETFGTAGGAQINEVIKEGDPMKTADVLDDSKAKWNIVQEYVRDDARSTTPTGWETVSPPIFNRDYLRNMAGFVLRLGSNPFGREAEFTGAHQTYDALPQGTKYDAGLMGRAVANYLLMMQQFGPQIFSTLQVERYGGWQNFFIRPIVLDHPGMLRDISAMNPAELTIQNLEQLMNSKYAVAEFDAHVRSTGVFDAKDKAKMLAWPEAKKRAYPKLWKYHDLRIHFNAAKPERTLVETRIGDYRQGAPEEIIRVTFFNQMLLTRAFELAKENKVFQVNLPDRLIGESDKGYWERLSKHPASTEAALFETLKLDEVSRKLLRAEEFVPKSPKFAALERPSYGYEKEFIGHEIVDVVVPKDPQARSKWRAMSGDEKVQYFADLIADSDMREKFINEERLDYTPDTRRIVMVEFEADTMRFPHLDPDLFIEDSGSFEIKSNGRDIFDEAKLFEKMVQTARPLKSTYFGAHVHLFVPDSVLAAFRADPSLADQAGSLLERVSLLMQVEDYKSAESGRQHAVDSWSLDRYSQKDIEQVMNFLKGKGKLGNIDQKYHNIGMREVNGGLDIELRSVGNDLAYMKELLNVVSKAFLNKDFGVRHLYGSNRPLFHDFTHATDLNEAKKFTIFEALEKRFGTLTPAQKKIAYMLQFEVYKPAMGEYMFFADFESHIGVPADKMDTRFVRANFESNVALPILNFEEQPYMSQAQLEKITAQREAFLTKVYAMVQQIEKDPKYKFLLEEKNFLHLIEWLQRSTHASKPDFSKVDKATAKAQRALLEGLTARMRGYVISFVNNTEIPEMVRNTFSAEKAQGAIDAKFANMVKLKAIVDGAKLVTPAKAPATGAGPGGGAPSGNRCEVLFKRAG